MDFFKKNKKQKQQLPAPIQPSTPAPQPRAMDEINKVYGEVCARAGQLQYKISVDKEQLDQLNAALRSINQEADARQKLDAEAAAKASEKAKEADAGVTNG